MENLSFQYPVWLISLCVLGALAFVALLYWRSPRIDQNKRWLQPLLFFLRFLPILSIGLLLLGPMIKRILEETKPPSIVILQDNSQSVGTWMERTNSSTDINTSLSALGIQLSEKYNVSTYSFGDKVSLVEEDSLSYEENLTNLSDALNYIVDVYEGENLGSIILTTDGIFNTGQNPLYTSLPANIPIHCLALGDTARRRDVLLQTVLHNEVTFLNDEMVTQVDIRALNAPNQTLKLTVQRETPSGYITIDTRDITVRGNDFFTTEEIQLSFDHVGIQHYRYRLSTVNNEINKTNNRKDIYIEVLDARQEIGIVAAAPHPDITALKQLLEQNKNYEVHLYYESPTSAELGALDLVIFHNLPSEGRDLSNTIGALDSRKIPRLYIVGGSTDLSKFNQIQTLITIKGKGGSTNNAQGEIDRSFENFTLSDRLTKELKRYPPLSAPFGEYSVNGNIQTLLHQNIGDIPTDFPLLSFSDIDGIKTSYLFGNDIWRWKLFDYLQNENFDLITELLDKVMVYTSTKEDKRKFRVSTNNNVFVTNENIIFTSELYNNSYELINDPEVLVKLRSNSGSTFNYTFSRDGRSYILDIGRLTPDSYDYEAETLFNGEQYVAVGRFVVKEIQFELYDLEARHNLLYALAQKTHGSVVYPNDIGNLGTKLINADHIAPVIYQNTISKPLIETRWLFLLLVFPLMLEWLFRRYFGSL